MIKFQKTYNLSIGYSSLGDWILFGAWNLEIGI
jgi:hypothetical protein